MLLYLNTRKKPISANWSWWRKFYGCCKICIRRIWSRKILIPTTFGTGAEMTTYCVLKFDGKKKLLGPEKRFLADRAIIDSYFMDGTPEQILKNSVCDACAQATEGYDSKMGNELTRTLCKQAFDVLYDAIMNDKPRKLSIWFHAFGYGFWKLFYNARTCIIICIF